MATPNQQRSRYPRPLKATHSFTASGEQASSPQSVPGGTASGTTSSTSAPGSCHSSVTTNSAGVLSATSSTNGEVAVTVSVGGTPPASPKSRSSGSSNMKDSSGM